MNRPFYCREESYKPDVKLCEIMLKRNNKYCVKCKEKKLKTIKEFDRIMGNMGGSKDERQSGNKE